MRGPTQQIVLQMAVTAGLTVDAYVHFHLAANYQLASPGGVGGGTLFRIEGALALLAIALVLWRPVPVGFTVASAVALGGAAVVVLYRYVDVGAIGPVPSMYEPIWFAEKTVSAVAEAAAGILALVGVALGHRRHDHRGRHLT